MQQLIEQLEQATFAPGSDQQYRAGWNAAIAHTCRLLRVYAGLAEIKHAPVIETRPLHELFDLGGES